MSSKIEILYSFCGGVNKLLDFSDFIESIKDSRKIEQTIILDYSNPKDDRKPLDFLIKKEDMPENMSDFCDKHNVEFLVRL